MESPSPTPSQAPARELHLPGISSSPPKRRSSRPPAVRGSTMEMPAMREEIRRPPIPKSRREMELGVIGKIVAKLMPSLSEHDRLKLDVAAKAAENVAGISPKTEFIARLDGDLFITVLETYRDMEK